MLFVALVTCFCLGMAAYPVHKELRYRDQGVRTTAQVIQKEQHYSGGRHGSGWHDTLKYRYQDSAGAAFEGQGDVSLSIWERSEKGHDLAVEYLRDEPSESRPVDSPFRHWSGILCWVGWWGGLGLIILLCLLYGAIVGFCKRPRR
jgi:hypothetical protein